MLYFQIHSTSGNLMWVHKKYVYTNSIIAGIMYLYELFHIKVTCKQAYYIKCGYITWLIQDTLTTKDTKQVTKELNE